MDKKRRTFLLAGASCLAAGGAAYAGIGGREVFGAAPAGERLERIRCSPHYRDGMFRNLVDVPDMTSSKSGAEVMLDFLLDRTAGYKPSKAVPSMKADLSQLPEGKLVWLGHSGFYLRAGGLSMAVDPALGRASPVPFTFEPFPGADRYRAADIPPLDVLFITHDHYDHLDCSTAAALASRVKRVVCPLGVGADFELWGYPAEKITELDWGEEAAISPRAKATLVPSQHFSGRLKRNYTLWGGFVLEIDGRVLYISGDGGYGPHFKSIAQRWPRIDFAILEDGQYSPDWSTIHLMPADWRRALEELGPAAVMACHNSKYDLSRHLWIDPLNAAFASAKAVGIPLAAPEIGEALTWTSPEAALLNRRWWPEKP